MLTSQKQIRRIVVNDVQYSWKADWFYADRRIIRFRSWLDGGKSALRVNLFLDYGPPHPADSSYIHPKEVRKLIEYALKNGWQPNEEVSDFWLSEADSPLEGWKIIVKGPRREVILRRKEMENS